MRRHPDRPLHRVRTLLAAALIALVAGGCFQTETVLTVRPDGSATLVETTRAEGYAGLVLFTAPGAGVMVSEDPTDPRALGRGGAPPEMGDGVTLVSVSDSVEAGAVTRTTVYAVADVAALRYRFGRPQALHAISGQALTAAFNPTGTGDEPPSAAEIAATSTRFERDGDALRIVVPERVVATRDVWSPDLETHTRVTSGTVSLRFAVRAERSGDEAVLVALDAARIFDALPPHPNGYPPERTDLPRDVPMDILVDRFEQATARYRDALRALAADAADGADRPGLQIAAPGSLSLTL